jgi:hypothetical protein
MMMRTVLRLLLLTIAFYLITQICGWWGVPLAAAVWGLLSDGDGLPAAIAASAAWAALLVRDAAFGPLGDLAATLGGLFHVPPVVLVLLTVSFPALLAWSAAVVSGARRSTGTLPPPAR